MGELLKFERKVMRPKTAGNQPLEQFYVCGCGSLNFRVLTSGKTVCAGCGASSGNIVGVIDAADVSPVALISRPEKEGEGGPPRL